MDKPILSTRILYPNSKVRNQIEIKYTHCTAQLVIWLLLNIIYEDSLYKS